MFNYSIAASCTVDTWVIEYIFIDENNNNNDGNWRSKISAFINYGMMIQINVFIFNFWRFASAFYL